MRANNRESRGCLELMFRNGNSQSPNASWRDDLIRGGIGSIAIKLVNVALGFLCVVVLARFLGPDRYGVYAFSLSIISLLAITVELGLPTLIVRQTATALEKLDWAKMKGIWQWGTTVVLWCSLITIGCVAILILNISDLNDNDKLRTITVALPLMPILALTRIKGAAVRGLHHTLLGQLPDLIVRHSVLLLLLLISVIMFEEIFRTPEMTMAMNVFASICALAVSLIILYKLTPFEIATVTKTKKDNISWLRSCLTLAFTFGLVFINTHMDTVMLGMLRTNTEVGIYRVSAQVAGIALIASQALNIVLMSHFAKLYARGEKQLLQKLVSKSVKYIFGSGFIIVVFLLFLGQSLLINIFGAEYQEGYGALVILCFGQLFYLGAGSVGHMMTMTGHEFDAFVGLSIGAVVNIILNLFLIPLYGIEGAAIATAFSVTTSTSILCNILQRKTKINAWIQLKL